MGRWRVAVALTLLLGSVTTARADVADYLGKPITAVRVESEGRRVEDRALLALLETTVGRPLAMRDVRASIAHVFSLGRFADVVVRARPSLSGVALVYELQPIHPVRAIRILGSPGADGFDRGGLRRELEERFGVSPPAVRSGEMASFLAARLRDRGYRRATVMPRVDVDRSAGRSTLVFDVTAGARTRIAAVEVSGGAGAGAVAPGRVLERLEISAGAVYEPEALQARVERYVQDLKDLGHYNARVGVAPEFSGDETTVRLAVDVAAGPRVRVAFTGDPLPGDRRDDLVPIVREGAVDEDLLEDSAQRIVEYFRGLGY
ncbi:MAG: POTRA domain-containing protein, partial [Vicinamibacterales bacterium]